MKFNRWETSMRGLLFSGAAMISLCACTFYEPAPLAESPDLMAALPKADSAQIRATLPHLPPHVVDPGRPLDMTDIEILAVINDPDLKALRTKRKVGEAQVFSAGLLPDPQLSYNSDHPVTEGAIRNYSIGLTEDITSALILHGSKVDAAENQAKSGDLDTLWQEWQVVQNARQLYVTLSIQRLKHEVLSSFVKVYRERSGASRSALEQGDTTADISGADLAALADAEAQLSQLNQDMVTSRHDMAALLGLSPDIDLQLAPLSPPSPLAEAAYHAALGTVAKRRPDLLALQAGYDAQDATLRTAILGQFPGITIGPNHAKDNGNIVSNGFSVALNLPLFNGNRGEVAIQEATRDQLRQEYQARLDHMLLDTDQLHRNLAVLAERIGALQSELPVLEDLNHQAERAWEIHDVDNALFLTVQTSTLTRRLEKLSLQQSFWTNRIALDTLLGWPDGTTTGENS